MKIKGILLIGTKEFIVRNYGEREWEKFLDTLPDNVSAPLRKIILPGGLYDLQLYTVLNKEADRYFGSGDGKLLETIGRTTADESMELYASVFKRKLASPEEAIDGLVPLLANMLFENLETESINIRKGGATYTLRGRILEDEDFAEILGKRSIGWIEEILSKIGTIAVATYTYGRDEKGPFLTLEIKWE